MKKLALVSLALIGFGLTAVGCASKETVETTETTSQVRAQATEVQQQVVATDVPQVDVQSQDAAVAIDPTAQVTPAQNAPLAEEVPAYAEQ